MISLVSPLPCLVTSFTFDFSGDFSGDFLATSNDFNGLRFTFRHSLKLLVKGLLDVTKLDAGAYCFSHLWGKRRERVRERVREGMRKRVGEREGARG